jgi:hypothetical protein
MRAGLVWFGRAGLILACTYQNSMEEGSLAARIDALVSSEEIDQTKSLEDW